MKKLLYLSNLELTCLGEKLSDSKKKIFKVFLNSLNKVTIVYRCLGDKYLNKQYKTSVDNINVLSKLIFLYGDKGKLFYEELDQKTFNTDINKVGEREITFIYNKMKKIFVYKDISSPKTIKSIELLSDKELDFMSFWKKISITKWKHMFDELSEKERIAVRDYYVAILHTVGLAGYGRNSYFLSTSKDPNIGYEMNINYEIEIVGWTNKKTSNQYGKDFFDKNNQVIEKLHFPIISNQVFPSQEEITCKCGILPHFIIGYCYNNGKTFEVNPCVFKKQDFHNVSQDGLPIDQSKFYLNLQKTNYKSTYIYLDDLYFQV